ncbi:MAG: DUF721 domain-containing protein [Treponema sp.]|jgi:hypothetical protein|nr:DUF721 domain-containing protein [Treponema sp.]
MKKAGDILSALFDERFMQKAQGYSKLFNSWADITARNGIASAADHSRIKELDRGILLIELDHPGWKQILQTKQTKFLNDFRIRFPELNISGISLMLGQPEAGGETIRTAENIQTAEVIPEEQPSATGYNAIKDDDFREKLIKLGQSIAADEKAGKKQGANSWRM